MRETTSQPDRSVGPWSLNRVHNVDCQDGLRELPDDVVDVIVTSPPYWGQRESKGLGLEENPLDYVTNLADILEECMRCLKPSGTLWLNIGDAYNTPINWRRDDYVYSTLGADGSGLDKNNAAYTKKRTRRRAFIEEDLGWAQYGNLLGIPYRVVLEMTDRGFFFRGEVVWVKSRPMPEGRCRRPHRQHEGIYILTKAEDHAFRVKPPVGSVWELTQTPNPTPHCSTFPLDLPMQCIEAAGLDAKGLVLDPFMGSGTTGKAALQLGHDFVGFEVDRKICEVAASYIGSEAQQALL